MARQAVVIAGGATGLMLAGEVALAGVADAIVERHQPGPRRRGNRVAPVRWAHVTLFHEAEHAAYVLRKRRCPSRSTGASFREREVSR